MAITAIEYKWEKDFDIGVNNENGAVILTFLSKDASKHVRFDFNRPYPHQSPHMHLDEKINRILWNESGQIYPTDVPHF